MDERGGVHHFDDGAEADGALAEEAHHVGGEQKNGWADALAAALAQILGDLGDGADAGGGVTAQFLLNGYEIIPQQLKDFSRRRYRQCAYHSSPGAGWSCFVGQLIRPVIGELQIDAEVFAAEQGDDALEIVAVFAADSDSISLDAGLDLLFRVLD